MSQSTHSLSLSPYLLMTALLSLLLLSLFPGAYRAEAQPSTPHVPSTYRFGSTVRVPAGDTLSGNVLMAGQVVEMMGTLDNDFFAASRHLILNGSTDDDAMIAGQYVSFSGSVGDMLAVAGGTVIIDGVVGGDLFAAGAEVRLTPNARILGRAFLGGERVEVDGARIEGPLRAAGEHLSLNGEVNSFVELYSNDVTFGTGYRAAYSTTITSEHALLRENLGRPPGELNLLVQPRDVWATVFFQIWFFLSLFITGLILILIFQRTAIDMHRFATEKFWRNTGIGLLAFLGVPLAVIVLLLLVVTIPLSFVLSLLYALVLLVSYLLVAMTLGVASIGYFREEPAASTYYWGLGLGMIYIAILVNLPYVGWLIHLLLLFFGLGSVAYYIWKMSQFQPGVNDPAERG